MIELGEIGVKQVLSISLMVLFALGAMFFLGYRYAYEKAIGYANNELNKKVEELDTRYNLLNGDTNIFEGVEIPNGDEDG